MPPVPASPTLRRRAGRVADRLAEAYPDAGCALSVQSPLEVLVATILSAQCTDAKVNEVTPHLFARYPSVSAFAEARQKDLERLIKPIGLQHAKAGNIIACCQQLRDRWEGVVPDRMEDLVTLPGVGRKTANCVLVNAFDKPGLMTDTHFCRIVQRLGLTEESAPPRIEAALAALLPPRRWGAFSHQIIVHGRRCCKARRPACPACPLRRLCRYAKNNGA